jgi:predicted RNA binding protein YcfA (HicA-like mRNA interferase family)
MSYSRRKILRALAARGIVVEREGANHTIVVSPAGRRTAVARHSQINRLTARSIAKQLQLDWKSLESDLR